MNATPLILVTNDDGIASPGLAASAAALSPLGELLIVAPSEQQTSMARSRSQNDRTDGTLAHYTVNYKDKTWSGIAANATPALAVEHAVQEIAKRPIDLVVSGINYGENIGSCVTVSGTVGAALEAAELNIPAIAVSLEIAQVEYHQYFEIDFSPSIHFLRYFSKKVLENMLPFDVDILKIEIPINATNQTEWVVTRQDRLAYYQPKFEPITARFNTPHKIQHQPLKGQYSQEGTDAHALSKGLVSVTPLSLDLTSRIDQSDLFEILRD